ncbi:MAG: S8 family serine peptidase [Kiritimatiellae bacterium]|nr:S8 family serine peptidase [Kiritimatiellia bacterium]
MKKQEARRSRDRWLTWRLVPVVLFCAAGLVTALESPGPRPEQVFSILQLRVEDGRVWLSAENTPLRDILRELGAQSGVRLQVDPALDAPVTLALEGVSLEDALKALSASRALVYEKDGDGYRLAAATVTAQEEAAPAAPAAEAEKPARAALPRGMLTNAGRSPDELMRRGAAAILLQNALIDTEAAAAGRGLEVPEAFRAPADTEYHIVQFDGPASDAQREALEEAGALVSHYVPRSAFAVHADAAAMAAVKALPGVTHVEPYHPYFKMSGEVLDYLVHGEEQALANPKFHEGEFNVVLFRGVEDAKAIEAAGLEIVREQSAGGREVLTVRGDADKLTDLVQLDAVQWVEASPVRKPMNDLGTERIRAKSLKALHPTLTGAGVIVGITDSGIDFINPGFAVDPTQATSTNLNTRIVYYDQRPSVTSDGFPGDNNGHGTHVAGSILGNGALSETVLKAAGSGTGEGPYSTNYFAGAAPGARVVMIEDFNSFTDEEQAEISYNKGARLSNNSWGNSVNYYGSMSMLWDELVRDAVPGTAGNQEYIVFFAAGNDGGGNNDGTGGEAETIGQPGNAKNVITVGAVEQKRLANNLLNYESDKETDTDWQVAGFSSRGPVLYAEGFDRRIKPDIMAPGAYVLSVQSRETMPDFIELEGTVHRDYRYGNIDSGTNFAFFSGTSMATPLTAGGGALMFEYYTNTFGKAPSPAMMKAMMVGGARMLNSIVYKNAYDVGLVELVDQGWGLLDVVRSVNGPRIQPTDEIILLDQDQTTPLSAGQFFTRQVKINAGEGGLKVALAWTDPAGTPGLGVQLVNDLDLYVQAPGGGGYIAGNFELDGAHSRRFEAIDPEMGDEYNNVETIVIPTPTPGTYTIQVYGYAVPQGPQDFALSIMKGIGMESRNPGDSPDVAMSGDDRPVIAYSTTANGLRQVYTKRWIGEVGDISDIGKWKHMDGQWFEVGSSASGGGVSKTLAASEQPSVAASGTNIFVAWAEQALAPFNKSRIYFRQYNGSSWIELGSSANDFGVSGESEFDATKPVVAVMSDGRPVVAWKRTHSVSTGQRVFVAKWSGTNWIGLAYSHTNGIAYDGNYRLVDDLDMVVDSSGMPVVSWADTTLQRIVTRRWNGSSWSTLPNQGNTFVQYPKLAAGTGGSIYLTWVETYGSDPLPYLSQQVYASRYSGGSWSAISGSTTFPGISAATSGIPRRPSIAVSPAGTVFVTWAGGTNLLNSVYVKRAQGGGWVGVAGAGEPPGVALVGGVSFTPVSVTDSKGVPIVVYENTGSGESEVLGFKLVADTAPPIFGGLLTAEGGTNNNVALGWNAGADNFSTNIYYHIYRGTNAWDCWETPMCPAGEVFGNLIAVVTNTTAFTVTNLTNYKTYCFGVRAMDDSGFMDSNTVTRSAGPTQPGVDCLDLDSDSDGMPDHWEILHGFDPFNPADAALDADGDGLTNLEEYVLGTHPRHVDSDGDGLTDGAEVLTHQTDPTKADSDGDGLDDGFELAIGTDPRSADSNANGVSDGDIFQLGYDTPADAWTNLNIYLAETFETSSRTNWAHSAPNAYLPLDLWHLSTAEPGTNAGIRSMDDHTPSNSYRLAYDPSATNPAATYSRGQPLICALDSPRVDALGTGNLYVAWREFYDTEPIKDFITVQARGGGNTNWTVVAGARSGESGGWFRRVANLGAFAGQSNVQVRFLFTAQNAINNDFNGWYVDDVMIYQGATIFGWVRDINGRPIVGATVRALGRGGVTNVVQGHPTIPAPKIFGEAATAEDGSYMIAGIPLGRYYLKADEPSHRAEFWNGALFTAPYSFGSGLNPGVYNLDQVGAGGYIDVRTNGAVQEAHFELERGENQSFLGVSHTASAAGLPVIVDYTAATLWNGSTSAPALVAYSTTNVFPRPKLYPDWLTNAVKAELFAAASPGEHRVGMGAGLWRMAQPAVETREGEVVQVDLRTNAAQGYLYVASLDGMSYPVWLNGLNTGSNTPARLYVQAGTHLVQLAPTNGYKGFAPQLITAPIGNRLNVSFTEEELTDTPGALMVDARDAFGNVVSGAQVVVNGRVAQIGDVAAGGTNVTPTVLTSLRPGPHRVSVLMDGFRRSAARVIDLEAGYTNYTQFALYQADQDADNVGDYSEIQGYTNIFLFTGEDDPDGDTLINRLEYDLFRLFGIRLNIFNRDTDADAMPDGEEVGYKGWASSNGFLTYAWSVLYTNAVQNTETVEALFVGRYLDGISAFGSGTNAVSIEGDRFEPKTIAHTAPLVPTKTNAVTVFGGIPTAGVHRAVIEGHPSGTPIFADTRPDVQDTSGDGMWDGFKWKYRWMTNAVGEVTRILDPIEYGGNDDDPDWDGLNNYLEFLGPDALANTNDWTNPGRSDTDNDGLPDGWEYFYGLDPNDPSDAWLDPDDDDLPNYIEYLVGSNPFLADTDADGLNDGKEVFVYGSDPTNPDTDYDSLLDGLEAQLGTSPTAWDTDGDGMPDGFEVLDALGNLRDPSQRLNPLDPTDGDDDYDHDGLTNYEEYLVRDGLIGNMPDDALWDYWSDPFNPDSDGDGMPDGWEVWYGLHPMDPVGTRVEGESVTRYSVLATGGDPDSDGLWNLREYNIRFRFDAGADPYQVHGVSTDPHNPDTDNDGLGDGEEDRALRAHPLKQDTDGDWLLDGVAVTTKWGEVESTLRKSEFAVIPFAGTWAGALQDCATNPLAVRHPIYTNIVGHLAVPNDLLGEENAAIMALLGGGEVDIALGGLVADDTLGTISWVTGEAWLFPNYGLGEPLTKPGVLGMNAADGKWKGRGEADLFDHYAVEWELVPQVTNHYDEALNDLWQLLWPGTSDFPYWKKINVSEDTYIPPARWGAAMTYIPVYETKNPKNDTGTILMDNRKLVVIGGRDGVAKHRDVWEFLVRSNMWVRSPAPLNASPILQVDGMSELCAVPIFETKNTKPKTCPCTDMPYDCDGEGFGLPKNRPWDGHRSFDWTFIFGGWDDKNQYKSTPRFYKSGDSMDPVVDTVAPDVSVAQVQTPSQIDEFNVVLTWEREAREFERVLPVGYLVDDQSGTPDADKSIIYDGYSAIHFSDTALTPNCDQILFAELEFVVSKSPAVDLPLTVIGEFLISEGFSPDDYNGDNGENWPEKRITVGDWFNTTPTAFTVYTTNAPGTTNRVDVTVQVQELISAGGWTAEAFGFVLAGNADYAEFSKSKTKLTVHYRPSYKINAYWKLPTTVTYIGCGEKADNRKSAAMAYDFVRKRAVMFGGIDGNRVRGDTHEAQIGGGAGSVTWRQQTCAENPPARWGHSMVYDAKNERVVMFGGFDANHRPLNDLWLYYASDEQVVTTTNEQGEVTETATNTIPAEWVQVTSFTSSDRPQPRAGACMIYWGDWDYDRGQGDAYKASSNKRKIVLFGGTDGKTFFNDTWVYDGNRWTLCNPVGELSAAPPPRAFASMAFAQNARKLPDRAGTASFHGGLGDDSEGEDDDETPTKAAKMSAFLFGGRTGTIPTGKDTDMDLVDDGIEFALGGPTAGRDPRVNKLVSPTNQLETIPYALQRFGPVPLSMLTPRAAIADMESLRHDEGLYAASRGYPWESWSHPDTIIFYETKLGSGVETRIPEFTTQWYSRHGIGDPFDARNKWELGVPRQDLAGVKAAPRYAYSGRWAFGTTLSGAYVNDAVMELYSPIFSLTIPPSELTSTDTNNMNSFHLVFHEWLDLADANDRVKVELIRPGTPADIANRVSATNKPPISVVPERNFAYNTTGEWRRVVAPLDIAANEANVYLRFTLVSDAGGVAGGWYIDDVAIAQGGQIQGTYSNHPGFDVELLGANDIGAALATTETDANSLFQFGFLPQGQYFIYSNGETEGPIDVGAGGWSPTEHLTNGVPVPFDLDGVAVVPGRSLSWEADIGASYTIQYADEMVNNPPWADLATGVVAGSDPMTYTDVSAPPANGRRFYRVWKE